ncbi:MAG: DUF655 domain-containing protein [Candidatus Hodarchaeales archaeon]|jgi:putative nucleotide binding protein
MNNSSRNYRNHEERNKNRGREKKTQKEREKIGRIIEVGEDFLPSHHHQEPYDKQYPFLIVIGKKHYSILKLFLKQHVSFAVSDQIDLDKNKYLFLLIQRLSADKWTKELRKRIERHLKEIVSLNEREFVDFFNNAKPITSKLHQLKLLPGVGPKRMWSIIDDRKISIFSSYSDIEERTGLDPITLIVSRILEELETDQKYRLFTKAP